MSSWKSLEYASGCWISACHYEGPASTNDHCKFMVHATLDAGADKYFSGIRVIIGCKNTQELSVVAISDDPGPFLDFDLSFDKAPVSVNDRTLTKQWQDGYPSATTALPLCTLVFEVVDKRDRSRGPLKRVNLVLHPPEAAELQSLRTLYDHVELCTPYSTSCVLFLKANDTFRRLNGRFRIICARPASRSILAHGIKILPPSTSRKPSINLPSELLHMIFKEAVENKFQYRWRATLISFALVCRAWRPALDLLFEHFGPFNAALVRPDAIRLAKTIELNPQLGMKIRVFDPSHFRVAKEVEFAKAIVIILRNATKVKELFVSDTHRTLAPDFVRALCSSPDVESFRTTLSRPASEGRYMLSIDDILHCLSHWPRVHTLSIYGFSEASTSDGNDIPTPDCQIRNLFLQHGSLTFQQLHLLTASSYSTLQNVTLKHISGFSNGDLRTWLVEVGPTLTSLSIQFTPLSRRSDDEEYAVDAVLPVMTNLRHLELEGDVASELILLRYAPCERGQLTCGEWSTLIVDNMPGVDIHVFVSALKATGWTRITATNLMLREENTKLKAEATKIANDRNIFLVM